ncbi:MAG TPA: pyridoxamine 5'-phosphate oxidase family protein [Dermatophilaceae bacterium]|nr:pyridoxamine 5'-phosphate oxidase family protein [Dermatophilaceae bacterium]
MSAPEHPEPAAFAAFAAFAAHTAPTRDRPTSPPDSYGVPQQGGTFVRWDHVVQRLAAAPAYWLATVTPRGLPHVVPIWGVLVAGSLYLETGAPDTVKNRNLAANPSVAVHLDGSDDVVLIRGVAVPVVPGLGVGEQLAAAFRSKYPGYEPEATSWAQGGLYRVDPVTVLAWGQMPTATRWRFRS